MSGSGGDVAVIGTGVANTASVLALFRRLGVGAFLTADAGEVARARAVVLPGVGAFGAGMGFLRERGLADVVRGRAADGSGMLCVCLGMQLLGASSEETAGVEGLGVVGLSAARFPDEPGLMVPHFGWNVVRVGEGFGGAGDGYAYFANSYRMVDSDGVLARAGCGVMRCEHGGAFVAGFRRGGLLACQFHPELSGAWGRSLIAGWLVSCGLGVDGERLEGGVAC